MSVSFKEQCITLRKQGRSIIQIMQITGRPKTSVYFHIQNLPLSAARMERYRKASGRWIRQFALARKGKSVRVFREITQWTPNTVLLVAHLLFDGEIAKGRCAYSNRSEALIKRVEGLMYNLYDFESKRYFNSQTGVVKVNYFNVALSAHLRGKARELLSSIKTLPLELKREFVRAFFDDEGCMTFRAPHKRQVRGYQKDRTTLSIVHTLLSDFYISARIVPPNEIVISGKENLQKFQKEINFSPGVRINGNRSNSIWKESLEKRELLDCAIKSFKT